MDFADPRLAPAWRRAGAGFSPLPCTRGRGVGGDGGPYPTPRQKSPARDSEPPLPQPLSPEYRGEGSRLSFTKRNILAVRKSQDAPAHFGNFRSFPVKITFPLPHYRADLPGRS